MTVEDCGHGPVGGCCSKLWVGSHIIRQKKSCFKIRPAGPDFYGLWNKRNNDGAGGAWFVLCRGAGLKTAQDI